MNAKLQEVHSKREQLFQHARIFTQYKDQVSAQLSKIASQIRKRTRRGNELLSFYTANHIQIVILVHLLLLLFLFSTF